MTPEEKQHIEAMSYEQMLREWRFSELGSDRFIGERGEYFAKIMFQKRDADPAAAVAASKRIGW